MDMDIKQRLEAWVQANAKELLLEDGGHIEHATRMALGWVEDIEERRISDKQKQEDAEQVISDKRRSVDDWKERRRSNRQNPQIKVINRDKDGGEMEGTMDNPAYIVPAFQQRRTELLSGAIIYALEMAFWGMHKEMESVDDEQPTKAVGSKDIDFSHLTDIIRDVLTKADLLAGNGEFMGKKADFVGLYEALAKEIGRTRPMQEAFVDYFKKEFGGQPASARTLRNGVTSQAAKDAKSDFLLLISKK